MRSTIKSMGRWAVAASLAVVLSLTTSCIKNNIPYPYIELFINKIEGENLTQSKIDNETRTVYLDLEEAADIEAVNITSADYTEGATLSKELVGTHNLTNPLITTLSQYQDYVWRVIAQQKIEYRFKVKGQSAPERIDYEAGTVEVDVNEKSVDLSNVTITEMKLGPAEITTYSPTMEELMTRDFSTSVRRVTATAHGRSKVWSIRLFPVEAKVTIQADAWGRIAWLSATGDTSDPSLCRFEYREAGSKEWISVAPDTTSGGLFEAKITGLTPETTYEFRSFVDTMNSDTISATTESVPTLQNGGFEEWQKIGNTIFPYLSDAFWGTGNEGSTFIGTTNLTQSSSELAPNSQGSYSAQLKSQSIVGYFAAGNIFTGRYGKTVIPNGVILMGRPFEQRPLAVEGYAKYNQGVVTHTNNKWGEYKLKEGDNDEGIIYVALGTWSVEEYGYDAEGIKMGDAESPVVIDTRNEATFFDKYSNDVIAYGELVFDSSSDWEHFKIDLEYRDLKDGSGNIITPAHSRKPTHIIIICTSSRYGDYFTGSSSSLMMIDDFDFVYE